MPAALLLVCRPSGLDGGRVADFERVAAAFPTRVGAMQAHSEPARNVGPDAPEVRLRTWSHASSVGGPAAVDAATGSWMTLLGNPTRPDLTSLPADAVVATLLRDALTRTQPVAASLSPPFAIVFADGRDGTLHVSVDGCGLQHLFVREERDGAIWISSSLMALAEALGGNLDPDAAAEWLAGGHFVSERTLVREVRKLGAGEHLRVSASGSATVAHSRPAALDSADAEERFRTAFLTSLAACHADPLTAAELTGGLDSRLLLAGRLRAGLPTLSWTLGDPDSAELRTVRRLRRVAGFAHVGIQLPPAAAASLPELCLEMHALSDGEVNALEYAPLLEAFAQLDGQRRISISGSGGETARAYYHSVIVGGGPAAPSSIDVSALAKKVAGATGPALATLDRERFPDPLLSLRRAVQGVLASSVEHTPERALDDFYLRARMQRFAGRNITTTGLFARQGLPFFDNEVVAATLSMAPDRKHDGRAMRDALIAWAPELARIPLDSGIAVAPRTWSAPTTHLRWGAAMGRKAIARYGGPAARLATRPDTVPWGAFTTVPALRAFVDDVLPDSGGRVSELLDPAAVAALKRRSFDDGRLYALGLVLTLELSLRRIAGAR